MKPLKILTLCILFPATLYGGENDEFRSLFNGNDLDGWTRVNTAPSTWTVRDGMLVCSGKPIGELRTERMYQNFILELEWRHMRPKGNAGVFVWADDITARGVPFHRSIEVQVLENAYGNTQSHTTHGDIFPIHGARMTPINGRGGSRAFPTEERSKPSPEWNHYRVVCNDGAISLAVNGKVVTQGKDCSPRKGYICLESEGGIVHYRNLRIKELPSTPITNEHIAIADRGYRCLYTGVDLAGWKPAQSNNGWEPHDWILAYVGKASAPESAIETAESFGNVGFVFDVRRNKDSGTARLKLRGSKSGTIDIDPDDPLISEQLAENGRWNRFEGTLKSNRLSLSLNGETVLVDKELTDLPDHGPIRIEPSGPIDFANLYVRNLDP
jgi:hypothetical protein